MLYCFLDTNVLLQYRMFNEIDWTKLLKTKKVCLVIPRQVIRELDNHKNHSTSKRVKNRSRIVIRKIAEYTDQDEGNVRKGVLLQVQTDSPTQKWLEDHGYNPSDGDDRIVGEVHYFIQNVKQDTDDVILVAEDYGARIKAKASSVPQMEPPEELRLEDEPDPVEKENRELQKEVARLKLIQPKLSMKFQDERGNLSQEIIFEVDFTESHMSGDLIEKEVEKKLEELKYTDKLVNPEVEYEDISNDLARGIMRSLSLAMSYPTQNDIDNYHSSLLHYVNNEYSEYLKECYRSEVHETCCRNIQLVVENKGTSPATNIDVIMHFPDGFRLFNRRLQKPEAPQPPLKPRIKSVFGEKVRTPSLIEPIHSSPLRNDVSSTIYTRPPMSIRKTNGYEVMNGNDSLKHHFNWVWPPLFLYFEPIEENKIRYEISYSITADNLPDIVEGKLILVLKKPQSL